MKRSAAVLLALLTLAGTGPAARADDDEGGSGGLFGSALKRAAGKLGGDALEKVGVKHNIEPGRIESVKKTAKAFRKSAQDITEKEERFIGRAAAAQILARFPPLADEALNRYVQAVAQAVAMASDRPDISKGYHAQVLDTDQVNALSAPGGYLFVTKGLLRRLDGEDQLAAVLAHEIAHVARKHGLRAIKTSRLTSAFQILGSEAVKTYSKKDLAQLADAFGGAVDDVVKTAVVTGYGREYELEADRFGAEYASRANYDPQALGRFIQEVGGSGKNEGLFKTHPPSKQRVKELSGYDIAPSPDYKESQARAKRFAAALKRLSGRPAEE